MEWGLRVCISNILLDNFDDPGTPLNSVGVNCTVPLIRGFPPCKYVQYCKCNFSLPYDFLNNIVFSLAFFIVRIQYIIHTTYEMCVNWLCYCYVLLARLLVNSRLLVVAFWGCQKLFVDFPLNFSRVSCILKHRLCDWEATTYASDRACCRNRRDMCKILQRTGTQKNACRYYCSKNSEAQQDQPLFRELTQPHGFPCLCDFLILWGRGTEKQNKAQMGWKTCARGSAVTEAGFESSPSLPSYVHLAKFLTLFTTVV